RREAEERAALRQSVEEPLPERALVRADRVPAELLEVVDRGDEAGEKLVRERPRLEAAPGRLVGGRPHLVRSPRPQQLLPAEREPEMRPEELVRGAEEEVNPERGDVDRRVRRVVDGVRPGERAGAVCELDDPRDLGRRAEGVRGEREGDDACAAAQLPLEVGEVERRVLKDLDEADAEVEV